MKDCEEARARSNVNKILANTYYASHHVILASRRSTPTYLVYGAMMEIIFLGSVIFATRIE